MRERNTHPIVFSFVQCTLVSMICKRSGVVEAARGGEGGRGEGPCMIQYNG